MLGAVGIVVVFLTVFGGYMAAGGKLGVILAALPYEMVMIGGAAVGAFLIANDMGGIRHTLSSARKVFAGPQWKRADFSDVLCLLYELIRIARQNPVLLDQHIEAPHESDLFARYPRILADHEAIGLICDTLRSAGMNFDDPHQVEEVLDRRVEIHLHHEQHPVHALQTTADALPALGIVAAVLGVIKTMSSIDQPPEILGKMIGGALVGTFLGVFLSYGLVGPIAARLRSVVAEEHQFYALIRDVLVANLHNHPPNICVEVGRQNVPGHVRPEFSDLEAVIKELKPGAAA